jgi:hypothetical protein
MTNVRVRRIAVPFLAAIVFAAFASMVSAVSSRHAEGVANAATTTTLTSSVNPSTLGQSITFTATVAVVVGSAPGGPGGNAPSIVPVPTGNVSFLDGMTNLGTVALAGGVATLTTIQLAAGPHTMTAAYAGSPGFLASTSPVLIQTVNAPAAGNAVPTLGTFGLALLGLALAAAAILVLRRS